MILRRLKVAIAKAKSKGDRGQPCRIPREREKNDEMSVLVLTLAEGAEYKANP